MDANGMNGEHGPMHSAPTPTAHDAHAIAHLFGGGVYLKETRIPAGMVLVQHKHAHDHLSYLASGIVELQVDGITRTIEGPVGLTIEAGKHHGVKTLTDALWLCIHATDCEDEEGVDETLIVPSDENMQAMAEGML
jgi:quercetin dioxygenase-like cupin family protein